MSELVEQEERHGPIEIRATGEILDADFAERTIDIVVMPYEQAAPVAHRGKIIREIVARGAFDGIERRESRVRKVRVNYQHSDELSDLLGTVQAFYPDREEGLVASLKIRGGDRGTEALENAHAGILGGSAGFGVMPGGESWPERGLRRLTRLFLDHVALTPTPVYEGAAVLAVRSADEPPSRGSTPNLDLVASWALEDRLGSDPLYR